PAPRRAAPAWTRAARGGGRRAEPRRRRGRAEGASLDAREHGGTLEIAGRTTKSGRKRSRRAPGAGSRSRTTEPAPESEPEPQPDHGTGAGRRNAKSPPE